MANYPQYPQYPQAPQLPEPPSPPPSIVNAVKVMYVGAAIAVINAIVGVVTTHAVKTMVEQRNPSLTPSQANGVAGLAVGAGIVGGLLGAGLWLWMAWANNRGRSWARVLSTIFFAVATLGVLVSFAQAATAVGRILGIVQWAVGLAAIVLIWQRQSNDYYTATKQLAGYASAAYGQPGQPYGQPGQPYGQPGQPYGQPGQPYGHSSTVSRARRRPMVSIHSRHPNSEGRISSSKPAGGARRHNQHSQPRRAGAAAWTVATPPRASVLPPRIANLPAPGTQGCGPPDERAITTLVTARSSA